MITTIEANEVQTYEIETIGINQITCLISENIHTLSVLDCAVKIMENIYTSELYCYQMMNHQKWREVVSGLFQLLGKLDKSFSGSAAYVIGTLFNNEVCKNQLIEWMISDNADVVSIFLVNLNGLLRWNDEETLLNVSAIISSLAASFEGRLWLLKQYEFDDTIQLLCEMLQSSSISLTHNASLAIARITSTEEGCARIINQRCVHKYFLTFISALDLVDCQYNIVLTIACLFNIESCQRNMLSLNESSEMIEKLVNLLFASKAETRKGSCFALSLLALNKHGNQRILEHQSMEKMLFGIVSFLKDTHNHDHDLSLFSLFFLKSLICRKKSCVMLRDNKNIKLMMMEVYETCNLNTEISDKLNSILLSIEDLPKPPPPLVKDGVEIFKLHGSSVIVDGLKPFSKYSFAMFYSSEGAKSSLSEVVFIDTPESVPSAPTKFCVLFSTTSKLKLSWDEPLEKNGVIIGYELSVEGKPISIFLKTKSYIMTHLQSSTQYNFEIRALTSEGKGLAAYLTGTTNTLDYFAPSPPQLHVHGKTEIFIEWDPPKNLLGRLNYYELRMDNMVIYRGIERCFTAQALQPTKVYSFTVSAWMSEGRCESLPRTRRISKQYVIISVRNSSRCYWPL
ncbi:uncharacterized protein LOC105849225 isoform X3 [Hydra vulgaris]|uniref:uncharacterized protein LOC105849225 isoform X3 n=1 Tax=Hydra vulgaris TaxID=6087 RepID=UPI0032EA6B92